MKKGILIVAVMLAGTIASYSKGVATSFKRQTIMGGESGLTSNTRLNDTVTMVIINDAFVAQVLNRDLTIPGILKVYHFINTYVALKPGSRAKVKDTLITFTKSKTTFSFLKTSQGNTLTAAHIESNSIATAGIAVGISKDKFKKIIAVPNISDVVIIEDKERTHRFIYTFNGDKLASIVYESPFRNY